MQSLLSLAEEPLKSKIRDLFFKNFTYEGNKIDFIITQNHSLFGSLHLLWAEAKNGTKESLKASFTQLILTIGKHKFYTQQPPNFLGAFDAEKFAFIPYVEIQDVFYQTHINWNTTPSDHKSETFQTLLQTLDSKLSTMRVFYYQTQAQELKDFIKHNLNQDQISKYQVDKNNFVNIYFKWAEAVKDSISIDWEKAKSVNIIDADFYLADLLSEQDKTIIEKLNTILEGDRYKIKKGINFFGAETNDETYFKDNQKAHRQFWSIYKRPPRKEFWDYIIQRRDLLVSQDIRERKGAFFTPKIWVQKSQEYLAKALGEDWQEEYYIWDCAGGTGNLLAGLNNLRNIFCSTLDKADIAIINERISKGANLFENQVFQFDFLNDPFFDEKDENGNTIPSKLPKTLQGILQDENKRQKLILYINPPYAEATTASQVSGTGKNKDLVARGNLICQTYQETLGKANNELFAQFFIRIYKEINGCILASFSKLKYLNSQNFIKFRQTFLARFLGGFIAPANTFDNVKGSFPIGFLIWDTKHKERIENIFVDIFDKNNHFFGIKGFYSNTNQSSINNWLKNYKALDNTQHIALLDSRGNDFQNQQYIALHNAEFKITSHSTGTYLNSENILAICVYFAVRHAIPATWINDRDQFLTPNPLWEDDIEFQNDCLAFTLLHGQNRITSTKGINHLIPFKEKEVQAKSAFESDFMSRFLEGKISLIGGGDYKITFSQEAQTLLQAGKTLFTYYHTYDFTPPKLYNVNASLYDIKEFFQGRDSKGKMNPPSKAEDLHYKSLLSDLNQALNTLRKKLEPKIYEYGFLKE